MICFQMSILMPPIWFSSCLVMKSIMWLTSRNMMRKLSQSSPKNAIRILRTRSKKWIPCMQNSQDIWLRVRWMAKAVSDAKRLMISSMEGGKTTLNMDLAYSITVKIHLLTFSDKRKVVILSQSPPLTRWLSLFVTRDTLQTVKCAVMA